MNRSIAVRFFAFTNKQRMKGVVLTAALSLVFFDVLPAVVSGDTVTSRTIARIGTGFAEVVDSQSNVFNDLSVSTSGLEDGIILTSAVDANFVSEDQFQVNVANTWDFRNQMSPQAVSFGRNFEYEFRADGNSISVTASNLLELPLFSGAIIAGLQPFRWRILDLTTPNGFQSIEFDSNGTQSLSIIDDHDYLLRMSDNSNLSGFTPFPGISHSATFDVTVPAKFSAVPEPGTTAVLALLGICTLGRRRRRTNSTPGIS